MVKITINISELRGKDAQRRKDLGEFLQGKLGVNVTTKEDSITLDDVSSKEYLRVLIRKFLHKSGLKERFRPIFNGENVVIKRRREHEKE